MKISLSLGVVGVLVCVSFITCTNNTFAQEDSQQALILELEKEISANSSLSENMKMFVKDVLLRHSTNPVFVSEVKKQNAKNISMDEINRIDGEWKASAGDYQLIEDLMDNICAEEANILGDEYPLLELFVMDNQGANVGQIIATSDYWQGDEAKWKNSYNGGMGGLYVGEMEIDDSTNMAQQQVSLPVIDEDGTVVGAVCYGVDAESF